MFAYRLQHDRMNQASGQAPRPLQVALIGGGIGGLATLLSILNHSSRKVIVPHLYEAAPQFSEIGAGAAFGPNAVQAMEIIDPKLEASYQSHSQLAPTRDVNGVHKVPWHTVVMGMDGQSENNRLKTLEEIPGATPYNENRTKSIHRARFLDAILEILRDRGSDDYVSFNKRCVDIQNSDQGEGLRVVFADGSSVHVDALIGCDGVKSRVRQILITSTGENAEHFEPCFTGKYAYRGLIPMEEAIEAAGEQVLDNLIICGYGGHIVTFPIDKGKTLNVVAFTSLKANEKEWAYGSQWVVPSKIEDVLDDFKHWGEPVRKLLSMLRKPDRWGLFDHPPAKTYFTGRMMILGDSAHASTPHQGAGAGMAIEDGAVLGRLLGRMNEADGKQLETVFKEYDAARRLRTQRLVTTSRAAALVYEFEDDAIGDDVGKIAENLRARYEWIWNFDVETSCKEAIARL
jgi:salicylate hydroxylase